MWIGPRGSTFSTSRSQFNTLRCFQVNNLRQSYETKIFLREKLLLTNQIFPSTDYIRLPLAFLGIIDVHVNEASVQSFVICATLLNFISRVGFFPRRYSFLRLDSYQLSSTDNAEL